MPKGIEDIGHRSINYRFLKDSSKKAPSQSHTSPPACLKLSKGNHAQLHSNAGAAEARKRLVAGGAAGLVSRGARGSTGGRGSARCRGRGASGRRGSRGAGRRRRRGGRPGAELGSSLLSLILVGSRWAGTLDAGGDSGLVSRVLAVAGDVGDAGALRRRGADEAADGAGREAAEILSDNAGGGSEDESDGGELHFD
jgi:hypothetical protein